MTSNSSEQAPHITALHDRIFAQRIVPVLGSVALAELTVPMVVDYLSRRAESGVSPAVILGELRLLERALDAAVAAGHIAANPCCQVARPITRRPAEADARPALMSGRSVIDGYRVHTADEPPAVATEDGV